MSLFLVAIISLVLSSINTILLTSHFVSNNGGPQKNNFGIMSYLKDGYQKIIDNDNDNNINIPCISQNGTNNTIILSLLIINKNYNS